MLELKTRSSFLVFPDSNLEKLDGSFTAQEIKLAISQMGPLKAPREDGFPAIFF